MNSYFIYIVECSDQSYYTGMTNNLERRIEEHNFGADERCYTFNKRPLTVVYIEEFNDVNQAIVREKQLKGWSRVKKEALITEKFMDLPGLSKRKIKN